MALTVSELWIYPIKSLGGIAISQAAVLPKGIAFDRRWMLVDADNKFMTQRLQHRMALFSLSHAPGGFTIKYHKEQIFLPAVSQSNPFAAVIWNDTVEVMEVSDEHNQWFSRILGITCKLVRFPENNSRPVEAGYVINNEQVSLADAYPLLIVGQNSLDDLNSRMKIPLPMNRFRPNIVFTGGEPYEEDKWHHFSIGEARFAGVKPCARCAITTIDQQTAQAGKEPLATLATYRQKNNKVLFGQNLLVTEAGEIKIGDRIILEKEIT